MDTLFDGVISKIRSKTRYCIVYTVNLKSVPTFWYLFGLNLEKGQRRKGPGLRTQNFRRDVNGNNI